MNALVDSIIDLRKYVEAAMDFPDEEVDFLDSGDVENRLKKIIAELDAVLAQARQGSIMKEGLNVVIAGEPNAGKSSLLNVLAGQSRAIVTEIAGTTRDILRESISIDGMPLHIIDTAGLHHSEDIVEQEGIRRAWDEIRSADLVLLVVDSTRDSADLLRQVRDETGDDKALFVVYNKADLSGEPARMERGGTAGETSIYLSAKTQDGIDYLKSALKDHAGLSSTEEGGFIARRRHLDALARSFASLDSALEQLSSSRAGELVAEDLRLAHQALESITGAYTPDDLLGEIFSSFCIGK